MKVLPRGPGRGAFLIQGAQYWPTRRPPASREPNGLSPRKLASRYAPVGVKMAATNKCLAQSNKSCTAAKATNKRPAARRNFVRRQLARPRCGVSAAGLPRFEASRCRCSRQLIESETRESITLRNRIVIEVHTASFRSTRGYTIVCALMDEIAYWPPTRTAPSPISR